MKRNIIITMIALIIILVISSMTYEIQAVGLNSMGDLNKYSESSEDNSGIVDIGNLIVWIVRRAGESISIVCLLIVGIKYILGSVEEKAEYKQTMWPYIIGALLIFAGAEITNIIYTMINQ